MRKIQLTVTLPQVNQILEALGRQPYAEVYELIDQIQQQAAQQLDERSRGAAAAGSDQEEDSA